MVAERAQCVANEGNMQIEKHPQIKKTSSSVSQHMCATNTETCHKYSQHNQIQKHAPNICNTNTETCHNILTIQSNTETCHKYSVTCLSCLLAHGWFCYVEPCAPVSV